ncbi:hypothetical protein [Methylosarcina fibrata]|uniref:hypothetical protein n=1 Tax=Methylosarcina fibrata TaxID=105972 RepID=UPI00036693CB|nr:hypothetical protein [Methylosarcina fibrata]
MQALELITIINEQHQIHLQLPDSVRAGKAKVIVLLEDAAESQPQQKRVFGQFRGKIKISEDFDNELPDDFWLGKDA